jgi:hypothetical protein
MHILRSCIFFHKSCSVGTPGHFKSLLLENHIHIIVLIPDFQRVSL